MFVRNFAALRIRIMIMIRAMAKASHVEKDQLIWRKMLHYPVFDIIVFRLSSH